MAYHGISNRPLDILNEWNLELQEGPGELTGFPRSYDAYHR